jgi:hypothetical protein
MDKIERNIKKKVGIGKKNKNKVKDQVQKGVKIEEPM